MQQSLDHLWDLIKNDWKRVLTILKTKFAKMYFTLLKYIKNTSFIVSLLPFYVLGLSIYLQLNYEFVYNYFI